MVTGCLGNLSKFLDDKKFSFHPYAKRLAGERNLGLYSPSDNVDIVRLSESEDVRSFIFASSMIPTHLSFIIECAQGVVLYVLIEWLVSLVWTRNFLGGILATNIGHEEKEPSQTFLFARKVAGLFTNRSKINS